MKIALINENSQAAKNGIIEAALKKVVEPMGHEVVNYGQGYPKERVVPEQRNKKILDGVRAATFKPLIECLKSIDQDLLKGTVAGAKFSELFFASCKDEELAAYVKTLL